MSTTNQIALYKFEDSVETIKMIAAGNLLLAVVLGMSGVQTGPHHRLLICLFTVITFYVVHIMYDWKSVSINAFLIAFYMIIVCVEIVVLGIPESFANIGNRGYVNKGIMLTAFTASAPYIYMGLRILLVLPLIQILLRSRKLG